MTKLKNLNLVRICEIGENCKFGVMKKIGENKRRENR